MNIPPIINLGWPTEPSQHLKPIVALTDDGWQILRWSSLFNSWVRADDGVTRYHSFFIKC